MLGAVDATRWLEGRRGYGQSPEGHRKVRSIDEWASKQGVVWLRLRGLLGRGLAFRLWGILGAARRSSFQGFVEGKGGGGLRVYCSVSNPEPEKSRRADMPGSA